MRRRRIIVATAIVALAVLPAAWLAMRPDRSAEQPPSTWVMGYYVGYLNDSPTIDDIPWDSLTHVVVGAAEPQNDGELDTSFFLKGEGGPHWARSVVTAAHAHGTQALVMIGGAESNSAYLKATEPAHRGRFVAELIRLVDELGADGLDLDWEPLDPIDGPTLLLLVDELRAQRPSLTLTVPVGPVNINQPEQTVRPWLADLAARVDRVNIMTYGMNGEWAGWSSWHSSALRGHGPRTPMSVESSYRAYVAAGVPPDKLGIGIGFFGLCLRGPTGPNQSPAGMDLISGPDDLGYVTIAREYDHVERRRWDDTAEVPYLTSANPMGPLGCTYISYEDERSIAIKTDFVRSHGLGGVIVWNINQGHLPEAPLGARDPLLDAVRRGILQ